MKITVIELLNKIANNELEDGTHIRNIQHDCEYVYHKKDCRFEFVKKGVWEDYFYKFDISELNDEIEIIEEPKEELEEIELIDIHYVNDKCIFKVNGQSIDETIAIKVNELIANQNKIIRELKANNKQ